MSSNIAIEIKNLSKKYSRNSHREGSLRGVSRLVKDWLFHGNLAITRKKELFWALRNIDMTIEKGEILGIIGNNGAGKSSLLKILAGITPPTEGRIEINGRIAPMLELGAGFHGDLTGRDNVFLNGAIIGMNRKEIEKHYDEIMEFSGLATFSETSLKYYSSGMRIRLAFAIAAFLQPEILLVDEVLAVGDVAFQRKCLDKMEEQAKKGITILFVSHDLNAIKMLCNRCIYIKEGHVKELGATNLIINKYLEDQNLLITKESQVTRELDKLIYIEFIRLTKNRNTFLGNEPIPIELTLKVREKIAFAFQIWMEVCDYGGKALLKSGMDLSKSHKIGDLIKLNLEIPQNSLYPGRYSLRFIIIKTTEWFELDIAENIYINIVVGQHQINGENDNEIDIDCNWQLS